jgi:hypothetical protein
MTIAIGVQISLIFKVAVNPEMLEIELKGQMEVAVSSV